MARSTNLFSSIARLLLPMILLIIVVFIGASVWLVYQMAHVPSSGYLMTPDKYGRLSARAAQITEESWTNPDGSTTKGWLLRGAENAPAVILYHKYGANRSYVLDMGVKLNESTNFTILMPDIRAHGERGSDKHCTFGGCEVDDVTAAIQFLRGLRTSTEISLVGKQIGIYGVELGSLYALEGAAKDKSVKAIAVDSVPADPNAMLASVVEHRYPFMSTISSQMAVFGTYVYFYDGCYRRVSTCETAKQIDGRSVMLLGGLDAPEFQDSTARLAKCLPQSNKITAKVDLSPSGYSIVGASLEQSEAYIQRIIEFFRSSLTE